MKIAKNRKHRRVRAASKATTALKRASAQSVQTMTPERMEAASRFIEVLGKFVGQAVGLSPVAAKTVRITKVNERFMIETRDYSCECGKADCTRSNDYLTLVFQDGQPISKLLRSRSLEEVDFAHMRAKRELEKAVADEQAEVESALSHALGNCECHGKPGPTA